ncbi:MAG TPA: hypothetical protein VHX44_04775 [Planctomycetota bacterium]|jgi:hypothetical protein|nr:hypothetical protein [Planctomycetota bacterium]
MRSFALFVLLIAATTSHLQAQSADSPVIGTWTGTLKSVMRNQEFTPSTQKISSDVTLVISRIANGNPLQDGTYILGLYVWSGLPIGGPPENGSLWSTGMYVPTPVGKFFGASSGGATLSTMTLIGTMTSNNQISISGSYITQWTFHDFTIKARRYSGPVDANGLPVVEVPTAISLLEQRFPWRLSQGDGLMLELAKRETHE